MKSVFRALRACLAAVLVALSGNAARAEQVHLTWFMWSGTEPEVVAWKHVAELVTQKYPDITVEFQTTSFPDYWTKLPALAAAGKLPDIVSLQSLRAPGFASLMVPLDDRIRQVMHCHGIARAVVVARDDIEVLEANPIRGSILLLS